MTLRILDHDNDADARIVAILMKKMGVTSIVLTAADEAAMADAIEGSCLVMGGCPDGSVELTIVADDDLPDDDAVMN